MSSPPRSPLSAPPVYGDWKEDVDVATSTIPPQAKPRVSKPAKLALTLSASLLVILTYLCYSSHSVRDVVGGYTSHAFSHQPGSHSGDASSTLHKRQSPGRPPTPLGQCPAARPQRPTLPARANPWLWLSPEEIDSVESWLERNDRRLGLNLTKADAAKARDNSIAGIELRFPAKADVLRYLDGSGSNRTPPAKEARVTIHHGARPDPFVRDYVVGPLPISSRTTMRPITDIYHLPDGKIPYNARGSATYEEEGEWLIGALQPLKEAVLDLFGGHLSGLDDDTFTSEINGPNTYDGAWKRLWITWRFNVAGDFLQPINFYNYLDMSGTDTSQWKVLKTVYHDQVFPGIDSFLEAWRNGTLRRHPKPIGSENPESLVWSSRVKRGEPRDLDNLPGPRNVAFQGLRFRVDRNQGYVSWMGWGFYTGFDRDVGLSLWDIRFKNERIVYELSPQEAIAQYSGADPYQPRVSWLDRHYSMGLLTRELLPDYDCPIDSVYMPASTWTAIGHVHRNRAFCIFEHDTGIPLTTHVGERDGETGATKGYTLTLRTITTVDNYDYLFDYIFHLDGTIEVKVSASGYLQGGYWFDGQSPYGYRLQETSMGNLHDHVINFKVDFDIGGTKNSLMKTVLSPETITLPWYDDDWGVESTRQRLDREFINTEDNSKITWHANHQEGYLIVNKEKLNKWGNYRGYSIRPGFSSVHGTAIAGSKILENNVNWAKHNMAVSQRKETEPSSSSTWNGMLPGTPPVNFDNFFNSESLDQEDLVLWINVGTHHIPHAEDAPHTKTNIATSNFLLTPMNYFDYDITMDSLNSIILKGPEDPTQPYDYDNYGVKLNFNCIPPTPPDFTFVETGFAALENESTAGAQRRAAGKVKNAARLRKSQHPVKMRTGI